MENILTDEQLNELCSFLRTIDVMEKYRPKWENNPEMKETYEQARTATQKIMATLSPEEQDRVLEMHKLQMEYMEKERNKIRNLGNTNSQPKKKKRK